MKNELPIPPAARQDKHSTEVVRGWIANGELHCSLNVVSWEQPGPLVWGVLLSDIARHIADALQTQQKLPRESTLAEIQRVFNEEIDAPTSPTRGGFVE